MAEQKMTYIMQWNGFQNIGVKRWTNGIHTIIFKKGYYLLFGKGDFCEKKTSYEMVDFLIENGICEPCPVCNDSRDSYFLMNGFSVVNGVWERTHNDKLFSVAVIPHRNNEYLFDGKTYTWALLKKKLREYGFLEVTEILPKGRINV